MVPSGGKGSIEDWVSDSNGNGQPVDRYRGSKGIGGFVEWDTDKERYFAKEDHEKENPDKPFASEPSARNSYPRIRQVEGGKSGTGRTLYLEALREAKNRGYEGLKSSVNVKGDDGEIVQGHTQDAENAQQSLIRRGLITRSDEGHLKITPSGEGFLNQRKLGFIALGGPGSGPRGNRDFIPKTRVVNIADANAILKDRGYEPGSMSDSHYDHDQKSTFYKITNSHGKSQMVSAKDVINYVQTPRKEAGELF